MDFIEMSGKTLKRIVSEDELQAIELSELGVRRRECDPGQPPGRHRDPPAGHLGRDRRTVGRFRPPRAPRNGPGMGRLLRTRQRGRVMLIAYIDPAAGSILLQAILAGAAGALLYFFRPILRLFGLAKKADVPPAEESGDVEKKADGPPPS